MINLEKCYELYSNYNLIIRVENGKIVIEKEN